MTEWKPIGTAPDDMVPRLVFVRGARMGDLQEEADTIHVAFQKKRNKWVLQDDDHSIVEPTHWMPLPEQPSA